MKEKVLENLKKLKKEAEADCKVDYNNLHFDLPDKLIKWINLKTEYVFLSYDIEKKRNSKYRDLYEFYKTEYTIKIDNKDEFNILIKSDPNFVDLELTYKSVLEIIKYIDGVIDTLRKKQWEVKQYIEWQKFKNGL